MIINQISMHQLGYLIGQVTAKIILIFVLIFAIYNLGIKNKKRLPLILLFIIGWTLYVLPMELRPFIKGNHNALFWCGIIPSFGCSFALPIFGLKNINLTYIEAKRKLLIYSFYTFGLLLTYELLELIKVLGTFDWLDLTMTILGLIALNVIFQNFKSIFEPIFKTKEQ